MKEENYLHILKEISSWRVVPGLRPGSEILGRLEELLEGVPCFVSPNGDLFIGADSPENLPQLGICLRAPLPGGGGVLRRSRCGKFVFSEVGGLGEGEALLGRRFGAYVPLNGEKLFELEVEMVGVNEDRSTLYFLADQTSMDACMARRLVLTQPSSFDLSGARLRCWNLSSLANAALLICLMKECRSHTGVAGILQFSGAASPAGLFPVDLWPLRRFSSRQDYGFEFAGSNPTSADDLLQKAAALEIPALASGVIMRIRIDNADNRANNGAFSPEEIPLERFMSYAGLAEAMMSKLAEVKPSPKVRSEEIEVCDEASFIGDMLSNASDFSWFLSSVAPALAETYSRHGLVPSALKSSAFDNLLAGVSGGELDLRLSLEELKDWAAECRAIVARMLRVPVSRKIKLVTILMLPVVSASSDSGQEIRVFLSLDKIPKGKVKETLFGELSFRLFTAAMDEMGLPKRLVKFYAEGVRYALPAFVFRGELSEELGVSRDKFSMLLDSVPALKKEMALYLSGETKALYEGKHHRFFKDRQLGDPYTRGTEVGYGSFLAALEVLELISAGKLDEKILSL